MKEDILDKVLEILNINIENIEISHQETEVDLVSLGMDSITFIRVIVALEESFGIEIPDEKLILTEMDTIEKIVDVVFAIRNRKCEDDTIGD